MKVIQYYIYKIIGKLIHKSDYIMISFFRKNGVMIGRDCHIYSNILTPESYLISIGNNVTISTDVLFITHDNSISKVMCNTTDVFGSIHIGDNCFIGARSTIMYGVSVPNNTIVAAGSVVVHTFEDEGIIIGGNPAKKIGTTDEFAKKNMDYAYNLNEMSKTQKYDSLMKGIKLVNR